MTSPKIILTYVYPPIPLRTCDWSAHYEGEEDEHMAIGHGRTAEDAVIDLIENHPRPDVFCPERGIV
jgi:hypothetical protein